VSLWFNTIVDWKLTPSTLNLQSSKPVVVGVSGGADSLCLLGLLNDAGYRVIVAHFNHKLRPEAESEAEHVRAMAEKMGAPFILDSADVADYAREQGFSLEEAARKLRYQFLFETARVRKAQAVAVAHTADDQVETILMHLMRGTGLTGLKGMPPITLLPEFDTEIPLVRPILHLWRSDTEAYCHERGLDFVLDASNADQTYFRNRLRHRLIPDLETYNPLFKKAVIRMARSLQDDNESLNDYINQVWEKTIAETGEGYIAFNLPALQDLSMGMRRNLLRRAMLHLRPGLRDVDFDVLDQAAQSARDLRGAQGISPGRRLDLTGGIYLYQEKDLLYIANYEADLPSDNWPQINSRQSIQLGNNELGNGWCLFIEKISGDDVHEQAKSNDDLFVAWMDADKMDGKLSVRPFSPGDSFQPFGMNGQSVKLSDFFVNIKLPQRAREHWPLLFVDNEIAWVTGLRLAQPFRLGDTTRQALRLKLKRLP
jgi:tRNA(Ile)-lysidine synthase